MTSSQVAKVAPWGVPPALVRTQSICGTTQTSKPKNITTSAMEIILDVEMMVAWPYSATVISATSTMSIEIQPTAADGGIPINVNTWNRLCVATTELIENQPTAETV